MAQQGKALVAKTGDLMWSPRVHMVGGNLTHTSCPLTPTHTHTQVVLMSKTNENVNTTPFCLLFIPCPLLSSVLGTPIKYPAQIDVQVPNAVSVNVIYNYAATNLP